MVEVPTPKVPAIDEALTRKAAELARLALTDEEVKTFTGQLRDILKYVEQLNEVKIVKKSSGGPQTHLDTLREDVARASPVDAAGKPMILGSAPDVEDGCFKVPSIL